jgi:diguanylate cyclase (GGDEF)-like protein/PAS domain S-box-containing protein
MQILQIFRDLARLNREGDVDPGLQSRLFGYVFWAMAVLVILGNVLTGGLTGVNPTQRIAQLSSFVLLLGIWGLWKRGRVNLAGHLMVWGFWLLATLVVLSEAGRASHWLVPQFLVVVLARFILNGRVAIFLGLLTAFSDFAIYQFDLQRYLPPELSELAMGQDWAAIALGFLFLLFIFFLTDVVLRETLKKNRISEDRYRSLFDRTNDAVFLIHLDLYYLEVNQKAADLLGYTIDELTGKPLAEVIAPEEISSMRANFEKVKKEGMLPIFERTVVRKDGSRRVVEVNVAQVNDSNGQALYHQSVMRDVTERKVLETQLRISLEEMETLAMQDSLTGLLNRRAITEHAEAEWHRAVREKRPVCIVLIDLDNLKDVNDTHGHPMGDQVIMELARVIKSSRRQYDWAGRWGGDEFMLVLPGANLVEAQEIADRLRNSFAMSEMVLSLNEEVRSFVSLGIACYSGRIGEEMDLDQLIALADQALYRAKQAGKNRVEVYRSLGQTVDN